MCQWRVLTDVQCRGRTYPKIASQKTRAAADRFIESALRFVPTEGDQVADEVTDAVMAFRDVFLRGDLPGGLDWLPPFLLKAHQSGKVDAAGFWFRLGDDSNGGIKLLATLATRVLSMPVSSASIERTFSSAKWLKSDRRASLAPATLEKLLRVVVHDRVDRDRSDRATKQSDTGATMEDEEATQGGAEDEAEVAEELDA